MTDALERRAAELRRRFDAAFAEPRGAVERERVDYLALRAGGQQLAVVVSALAGVASGRPVVALPGGPRALRGIVGWAGRPVPVYGLAALLGDEEPGDERLLALCRADEPFAIAFDALDGYLHVAPGDLRRRPADGAAGGPWANEVLATPEGVRGVLSVDGLLAEVRRLAGGGPGRLEE
jgi:purine-binding chemotaxis protein CheW